MAWALYYFPISPQQQPADGIQTHVGMPLEQPVPDPGLSSPTLDFFVMGVPSVQRAVHGVRWESKSIRFYLPDLETR